MRDKVIVKHAANTAERCITDISFNKRACMVSRARNRHSSCSITFFSGGRPFQVVTIACLTLRAERFTHRILAVRNEIYDEKRYSFSATQLSTKIISAMTLNVNSLLCRQCYA